MCGDVLRDPSACPGATAQLDVRFDTEGNCVPENGTPAAAEVFSVRRTGDECDALLGQRLDRQRALVLRSDSSIENCDQDGINSSSTIFSGVDESTSNQAAEAATAAGEEQNARCSSLEDDDNVVTKEEAEKWLYSRPTSPALHPTSMADANPATTVELLSIDSAYNSGGNRPISSMWSTPIGSGRVSDNVETKLAHDSGKEASWSHDTTADVTRDDDRPRGTLSMITSPKSTSGAAALSPAPNAHCRPKNGELSTYRKPRRDSFGASLQAAMNTPSVTIPKQFFHAHHEGGDGRSSSASTTTASKGPQLPRDQQRNVLVSRPTPTLAALRGTDELPPGQTLQGGSRPEDAIKDTRATAEVKDSHYRPPPCVEVGQASPCSNWMNDEEWLKVWQGSISQRACQQDP